MFMEDAKKWQFADEEVRKSLPPGVKLANTLRGHTDIIGRIAWSPDGRLLASPSADMTFRLWDTDTGKCIHKLQKHKDQVKVISFDKRTNLLASGSFDNTIKLWDAQTLRHLRTLEGVPNWISSIAFDPYQSLMASGGEDNKIRLWEIDSGRLIHTIEADCSVHSIVFDPLGRFLISGDDMGELKFWDISNGKLLYILKGHANSIWGIAFDFTGHLIASACDDRTINIWDVTDGNFRVLRKLEGHTAGVRSVSFAFNGELLASKDCESTVRLWNTKTGTCVAVIPEPASGRFTPGLAFHPQLPLLATVGSDPGTLKQKSDQLIHIWNLDFSILLNQSTMPMISYTSAKVVLVGDSGVGKTGLGWRLIHGEFREQSSTHGQQFWLLTQLCNKRQDGTLCEAILWDLAGQPDYRLTHALYLDDVDLALLLFDPTRDDNPMSGVEFWLKQLRIDSRLSGGTPTLLIAARSDRGSSQLERKEIVAFCKDRGIKAYLSTSAKSGKGIKELVQQMQEIIPWDKKPATVTTETFKRIKDFVLSLKERSRNRGVILTPKELRQLLEKIDHTLKFSDAEMLTAIGHLENHGYVKRLKTSKGEPRILLAPELLNNLAASFVLEARRNLKGLGLLEEHRLLSGKYKFPELENLTKEEKEIMLDSCAVLFLGHNICFRETDPLNGRTYLVFPELINLKKPLIKDNTLTVDDVAYTISGAVENVYASLVVLMGYTQTFTRTNQWHNHALYEVGTGHKCGFRQEAERPGELDFVLYFGANTPASVRMLFQGLFENFLARRDLTVRRIEPVLCSKKHILNRIVVREQILRGEEFAFCSRCGEKIVLSEIDQPIYLTRKQVDEVESNRQTACQRSQFEQILFRLKSYVTDQGITSPECFISYAWGNPNHELWVERILAKDLQNSGITVILDRWENARIGASVPRFIERVGKADLVIVVGTSLYKKKYENNEPMRSYIVAAEGDIIGCRMIGTETEKQGVLPVLLEGNYKTSFPPLLHGRVYADFRKNEIYFNEVFKLILSLYQISPTDPVAIELNESLMSQTDLKMPLPSKEKKDKLSK